mmetsp:Transcript_14759/g.21255  ORF Transcript_14759/g.21255 Transcript_14759/m.21255 type:complete len:561 (-) Transcript_14759:130-1812(-)
MGPSGSGKSSLMDALAGKIKYSSKLKLSGRRFINNNLVSPDSHVPAAYIEQTVNFFPHMTVRETLDFRAELKMGSMLRKAQRDELVEDLLNQLNLKKAEHTIVGNEKIRGLSGGERKRLSIACEMVSSPSVIFLDEPTSGLDSYQAMQVVETLRTLADKGKTIVAVIHQPSQSAFAMFDDLLLISEGKQMYFGEVAKVRSYLDSLGYKAAPETGTAEHVLDCISRVNASGGEAEKASLERIQKLADKAEAVQMALSDANNLTPKLFSSAEKKGPQASIFTQFKLLLRRSLNESFRGKTAIIIKMVQQVTLAIVYGGIYTLDKTQSSIQDRIGLLSLIAIATTNMGMAGTIRSFPKEKSMITSEMSKNMYRTIPYFFAKAIAEIPLIGGLTTIFSGIVYKLTGLDATRQKFQNFMGLIGLHAVVSQGAGLLIGSISSTSDVALAMFPAIVVLNIIFDGKNVSEENIPKLLRWIPKVGLIRWGFEGLLINEMQGLEFDTSGPQRGPATKTGEEALARFGMHDRTVANVIRAQSLIIAGSYLLSCLGLSLTKQKFMLMQSPTN